MIRFVRSKMKVWSQIALWPVIAAFIGTIFLVWGRGDAGGGPSGQDWVISVNDERVGQSELMDSERNLRSMYRRMYQDRFDELARDMDWEKMALESMVDRILIHQEAKRLDIRISDDEIKEKIVMEPSFHQDGRFDQRHYLRVLQLNHLTHQRFVESLRDDLVNSRVQNLIRAATRITRDEAWESYEVENEKLRGAAYVVSWSSVRDQVPEATDQEIQDAYQADQEEYRVGDQYRMNFVKIPFAGYRDKVELELEEIQDYYMSHLEDFRQEEQLRARHILFKTGDQSSEEEQAEARKKADEALVRARAGEDFAELATELSEGPSGPRGGDLGTFGRGRMVPEFETAAFGTPVGQISEVVQTNFGFHIIKVEEKIEESTKTEDEAEPEIRRLLSDERAQYLALSDADMVADALLDVETMAEAVEAAGLKGLTPATTDWFEATRPARELGQAPELTLALAEGLMVDEAGPILTAAEECVVTQLAEERPSHVQSLEEVRARVVSKLTRSKAAGLATERAESVQQAIQGGTPWAEAGAPFELEPQEMTPFARSRGYVPRIGNSEEGMNQLFTASVGDLVLISVPDGNAGLVKIEERLPPDAAEFDQTLPEIRSRLQQQKERQVLNAWIKQRRDEAEIELARSVEDVLLFEEEQE